MWLWRWKSTCAQISYFFSLCFFVITLWWESETPKISISNFMMLHIELGNLTVDCLLNFLRQWVKKCYTAFTHSCSWLTSALAWTFVRLCLCVKQLFSHAYEHSYVRMFVHIMRITIRPLRLVFEKPLPGQVPRMSRRMMQQMTRRICDW